jgi:hypothetical protein
MKGQMFVLTIIFLVGLIYVVQQNISGYSVLDISGPFEDNDYYIFRDVKDLFERTMTTTSTCIEAGRNLNELNNYIGRKILVGGFTLDLKYTLNCDNWDNVNPGPPPLNLTLKIIGKQSETIGSLRIYHQVQPTIYYSNYLNPQMPFDPCNATADQPYFMISSKVIDDNGDAITTNEAAITVYSAQGQVIFTGTETLLDDGNPLYDNMADDDIYGALWNSLGRCTEPFGTGCSYGILTTFCDSRGCSRQTAYCQD